MRYTLNYIRILTDNFPTLYEFYTGKLKMEARFGISNGPYEEFNFKSDEVSGATLSIYDRNLMYKALGKVVPTQVVTPNDNVVIIFSITDIDEFYTKFKDAVKFETIPSDRPEWQIRTAHIRDPDGNLLEFNQPLQ